MPSAYLKLTSILLALTALAPSGASAQELELQLDRFFQSAMPELFRAYNQGADSLGVPGSYHVPEEQLVEEIRLYHEVVQSSEVVLPSPLVLALCHNLLIHDPAVGERFLQLLDRPTSDEMVRDYLVMGAIAAGEFGENLALAGIVHRDPVWRVFWADYLRGHAIYESSVPWIVASFAKETNRKVKLSLIRALASIGSRDALDFLRELASTTKDDELQAEAIRAYTGIAGASALPCLDSLVPAGPRGAEERTGSIGRITHDSALADRYDPIRWNDVDLEAAARVGTSTVLWLRKEKLLGEQSDEPGASAGVTLTESKKNELLDSLMEVRGFGIWMVQGTLMASLDERDIPKLLRIRSVAYYAPDRYSGRRAQTVSGLVRYLRQHPRRQSTP